jgi:hypothetical protein
MRDELVRMASGRLAVQPSVFEQRLVSGAVDGRDRRQARRSGAVASSNGADARGKPLSGREDTERAFLALCVASPQEGEAALASLDIDEHFSSELLRRAARHLRAGDLRQPMAVAEGERGLEDDPELQGLLAELVVEAGRDSAHPAMLEVQRLQLELARVERQIQQARGQQSGEVSELARRKATVKREFDRAYGRVLEETGDREG